MINEKPIRRPNGYPIISLSGEVVVKSDITYMQLAAEELNHAAGMAMYVVELLKTTTNARLGHACVPFDKQRIRLGGIWALNPESDLSVFIERVEQIRADFVD